MLKNHSTRHKLGATVTNWRWTKSLSLLWGANGTSLKLPFLYTSGASNAKYLSKLQNISSFGCDNVFISIFNTYLGLEIDYFIFFYLLCRFLIAQIYLMNYKQQVLLIQCQFTFSNSYTDLYYSQAVKNMIKKNKRAINTSRRQEKYDCEIYIFFAKWCNKGNMTLR